MISVADTPTIARISSGLVINYNARQNLFSPAIAAPKSPVLIRMAADAMQWAIDGNYLTDAELRGLANYVIWLCNPFAMEAQSIIGAGGSTSNLPPGALRPARIDFTVTSSSFFATGSTGGSISNFIAYNLDMIRGGISQSTLDTEPSYFTWNRTTGVAFISPALAVGEVIALIPV